MSRNSHAPRHPGHVGCDDACNADSISMCAFDPVPDWARRPVEVRQNRHSSGSFAVRMATRKYQPGVSPIRWIALVVGVSLALSAHEVRAQSTVGAQRAVAADSPTGDASTRSELTANQPLVSAAELSPPGSVWGMELQSREWELRKLRFEHLLQRRGEGLTLLLGGLISTFGGAAVAVFKRDDNAWLAGGITTLSFGVINTLLGVGLRDRGGTRRRRVLDSRMFYDSQYRTTRARSMAEQRSAVVAYGVNFGLDFLYIAAGAVMVAMARADSSNRRWMSGAGIAMIAQGAFLWAFDLAGLIRARHRVRALEALAS